MIGKMIGFLFVCLFVFFSMWCERCVPDRAVLPAVFQCFCWASLQMMQSMHSDVMTTLVTLSSSLSAACVLLRQQLTHNPRSHSPVKAGRAHKKKGGSGVTWWCVTWPHWLSCEQVRLLMMFLTTSGWFSYWLTLPRAPTQSTARPLTLHPSPPPFTRHRSLFTPAHERLLGTALVQFP